MSTQLISSFGGESFADLFAESIKKQDMKSGEVISAEVVRIDHNFVVVNAGLKSEALIPIEEFLNDQGELEVSPGDFCRVVRRFLRYPSSLLVPTDGATSPPQVFFTLTH